MKRRRHVYEWPEVKRLILETHFDERLRSALLIVIETASPVLPKFRAAYDYRRKYPWLNEAREGLHSALKGALNHYGWVRNLAPEFQYRETREIDEDFKTALVSAVNKLTSDPLNFFTFWHDLHEDEEIDVYTAPSEQLKQSVEKALENYSREAACGTSLDPW